MAIQSVKFKLNGQTYNLSFDSTEGVYKATITAPSTSSYKENSDHKFHGEVTVTDSAGNVATATVQDFATIKTMFAAETLDYRFEVIEVGEKFTVDEVKAAFSWRD